MTTLRFNLCCGRYVDAHRCLHNGPRNQAAQPEGSSQHELAEEAQDYRAQAYALCDMASRRQVEAEVLSQKLGPNYAEVQQKLQLAGTSKGSRRNGSERSGNPGDMFRTTWCNNATVRTACDESLRWLERAVHSGTRLSE